MKVACLKVQGEREGFVHVYGGQNAWDYLVDSGQQREKGLMV